MFPSHVILTCFSFEIWTAFNTLVPLFICYLTETEEVGYDVIEVVVDKDSMEFISKTTQD